MRLAVKDVEVGHTGLYCGRELEPPEVDQGDIDVHNDMPLDVRCPRPRDHSRTEEGEPCLPAKEGLDAAELVREECDWWGFAAEYVYMTNLMNEFYRDVLCKKPREGHKWYLERAQEKHLSESINHNDGFYATLYGKVEFDMGTGRQPASGAEVKVYAPKDEKEWTTVTDDEGKYRIERAILHKRCSPFDISATYKGLKTETTYEGPLEEPDPDYEFEKNLLIQLSYHPYHQF